MPKIDLLNTLRIIERIVGRFFAGFLIRDAIGVNQRSEETSMPLMLLITIVGGYVEKYMKGRDHLLGVCRSDKSEGKEGGASRKSKEVRLLKNTGSIV